MTGIGPSVGDRFLTEFDSSVTNKGKKGIAEYKQGTVSAFLASLFGKTFKVTVGTGDKAQVHILNKSSAMEFLKRNNVDTKNAKPQDLGKLISNLVSDKAGSRLSLLSKGGNDYTGTKDELFKVMTLVQGGVGVKFDANAMNKLFPKSGSPSDKMTITAEQFEELLNGAQKSDAPKGRFSGEDAELIAALTKHVESHSKKHLPDESPRTGSDDSVSDVMKGLGKEPLSKADFAKVLGKEASKIDHQFLAKGNFKDLYDGLRAGRSGGSIDTEHAFAIVYRLIDDNYHGRDGAVKELMEGLDKIDDQGKQNLLEAAKNVEFTKHAYNIAEKHEPAQSKKEATLTVSQVVTHLESAAAKRK